ncbi:MAG: HEPN domain-containing protein [Chitinivibrionia bacterium]|nr:HEPN domain-containing protein [Chitinivibrionia bacterium]
MTKAEKYDYWLDIAEYDLTTAAALYKMERWLYVVFMCQQSIEKIVKGLYVSYLDDYFPRIHDINNLLKRFEDKLPEQISQERKMFFARLSAFYLENRYPEYKAKLSAQTNRHDALEMLNKTEEAFKWLKTLKPL